MQNKEPSHVRRILVARSIDSSNLNAQSRNACAILRRWRSTTWRPTVFAFREPDAEVAANPNVEIRHIRPDRWWRLRVFEAYQGRFDAIFYPGLHHFADFLGLRVRLAMGRGLPVISTIEELSGSVSDDAREAFFSAHAGHSVFCHKLAPSHLERVEWITRNSSHIVAISPFLARMAAAKYGAKVSELQLGTDVALWRGGRHTPNARPVVVSAGNVQAHKRPQRFLDFARMFPEADFTWFGEGDLRTHLASEAAQLGLSNLRFPGAVAPERLAAEFGAADIFVLPSKSEGVPKVTQEAAAAGLAQVVFGFFETPSVVNGENGFAVWNDTEFEVRLGQLLNDVGLRRRLGNSGEQMAKDWSWDRFAPMWERHIIECAELRVQPVATQTARPATPLGFERPN